MMQRNIPKQYGLNIIQWIHLIYHFLLIFVIKFARKYLLVLNCKYCVFMALLHKCLTIIPMSYLLSMWIKYIVFHFKYRSSITQQVIFWENNMGLLKFWIQLCQKCSITLISIRTFFPDYCYPNTFGKRDTAHF